MVATTGAERDEHWRDDLVCALLATTVVAGLFLDGWNHINLQDGALGGFFTRWHALLYAGFTAIAVWLARNDLLMAPGSDTPDLKRFLGRKAMRYPAAVVGLLLASAGMAGDVVWHTVFGDEEGVARVIAPFHLMLFTGAILILSATWRSAWYDQVRYPPRPSWRQFLPVFISITLLMAAVSFMFQWVSVFMDWEPAIGVDNLPADLAAREEVRNNVEYAGVTRLLANTVLLCLPPIFILRRWAPPPGALTAAFAIVASAMSALTELRLGWTIVAAVAAGAATEVAVRIADRGRDRRLPMRVAAVVTPLVLWSTYFAVQQLAYDIAWPFDLWVGAVILCVITSTGLSFLILPPAPGPGWRPLTTATPATEAVPSPPPSPSPAPSTAPD